MRSSNEDLKSKTVGRRVVRVLLTLLILYLLLLLAIMFGQRSLIYFPTKLDSTLAEVTAEREGFIPWKNESGKIIGWKLPSETPSTGSVLIVHGNAGCAIDRGYFAKPIHEAASVDVYILEYPGYGARDGSPSEESFLAAADEAFALLNNSGPIYVVSESLGTGVAAHLAKTQSKQVSGLLLFAPYHNFASLAQQKMPFVPVSLVLWDRFAPSAWLKEYSGPVKVLLAENDEIIPSKFSRRLYDDYQGPKNLEIIRAAYHNDIGAQSVDWWKSVFAFWDGNKKQN